MNRLFSSAPLTPAQWSYVAAAGLFGYPVVKIEK
jgi:hypothetical protein